MKIVRRVEVGTVTDVVCDDSFAHASMKTEGKRPDLIGR